ncbi:MAG: hypothetical protein ACYS47_14385 [Planctomycetota bacterium]
MRGSPAILLLAVVLAWAPAAAGQQTPPGEEGADETAALRKRILSADLVLEAKAIGVLRCCREGEFTGNFRIRLMNVEVLKGILGPVGVLEICLPVDEMGKVKPFLKRLMREDNPSFVVFLDEIARFNFPPLFSIAASPVASEESSTIKAIVKGEVEEDTKNLQLKDRSVRDAAFKALVRLGAPAVDTLRQIQRDGPVYAAEEARLAVNTIRRLSVDPFKVFQVNREFPCRPVPVFSTPLCRTTLFHLSSDTLVFRLNEWDDGNHVIYKIRTADGKEGWVPAKACIRMD